MQLFSCWRCTCVGNQLVDQVIERTHAAQSQSRCLNKLFSVVEIEIVERRHLVTNAVDRIGFQVPDLADIESRQGTQFHAGDVVSLEARDRLRIEESNLRRIESEHRSGVEVSELLSIESTHRKRVEVQEVFCIEPAKYTGVEVSELVLVEPTHGSRVEMTGQIGSERYALKNVLSKT